MAGVAHSRALQSHGPDTSRYDVDLLTLPIGERVQAPGARFAGSKPVAAPRHTDRAFALKLIYDGLMLFYGIVLITRWHYDVIHGIEDAGIVAWLLARMARTRFVFEKHSDPDSHGGGGFWRRAAIAIYKSVERFVVRRADAVIGTGPGLCEQAGRLGARAPIHHVPDIPSSLAESTPEQALTIRMELGCRPEDRLALYVGSFAAYQGIDLLLRPCLWFFKTAKCLFRNHRRHGRGDCGASRANGAAGLC